MPPTDSFATEIYCPKCAQRYPLTTVLNLCRCGSPLLVDYDYQRAAEAIDRRGLSDGPSSMWRYRRLLPVQDESNIVTLDEGWTPLLKSQRIGPGREFPNLLFKDESVNPTGSFKARGLGMAVSRAKELGIDRGIIPTAGNAGSALAAYAAIAGIKCHVIMPRETPSAFMTDCRPGATRQSRPSRDDRGT